MARQVICRTATRSMAPLPAPAGPSGLVIALSILAGLGVLGAITAAIIAGLKSGPSTPVGACEAEKTGIVDRLKAADAADKLIEAGGLDPWKVTAQVWSDLLQCPNLPDAFTKDTLPDRLRLFGASVMYAAGLLYQKGKISQAQQGQYVADVAQWLADRGIKP